MNPLRKLFLHFGYVIIPVAAIERMESDAKGCYEVMNREGISPENKGYFNGLGDHGTKLALVWREKYFNRKSTQKGQE